MNRLITLACECATPVVDPTPVVDVTPIVSGFTHAVILALINLLLLILGGA